MLVTFRQSFVHKVVYVTVAEHRYLLVLHILILLVMPLPHTTIGYGTTHWCHQEYIPAVCQLLMLVGGKYPHPSSLRHESAGRLKRSQSGRQRLHQTPEISAMEVSKTVPKAPGLDYWNCLIKDKQIYG